MLERIYKAQTLMHSTCKQVGRSINIMQISSGHTLAVLRNGIKFSLPEGLKLLSGPGCPVCVVDQGLIDAGSQLADRTDCLVVSCSDLLRMPSQFGSLESKQSKGSVKVAENAEQALQLAKANRDKTVVYMAVGFEDELGSTALAVKEAFEQGIDNFCILNCHRKITSAMNALLDNENSMIDAFLCPADGHGNVFDEIIEHRNIPCVKAGFEPMNIIEGLAEICRQIKEQQRQAVSIGGGLEKENNILKQLIDECFELTDSFWPGFGQLEKSEFKLKKTFSEFDAIRRFEIEWEETVASMGGRCGEIIKGQIEPSKCELFENTCTPEKPCGPCMASLHGTCAIWFKYNRKKK